MKNKMLGAMFAWLAVAAPCAAQTAESHDYLGVTTKMVIGANGEVLANYDQVLKVVGLPSVSGGASVALGVDSNGNIRQDAGTTINTGGAWTMAQVLTLTSGLASPLKVSGGSSLSLAALGLDNVRVGMNSGTPRLILEDTAGSYQIQQDNLAGAWRVARLTNAGTCEATGCVPLSIDGTITVSPYSKYILPERPYEVSIGSIQKKFGALWVSDLFAETLVAIDAIGTIGNHWLIGSTNKLTEDITSSATTIITDYNNFANGDFIYAMSFGRTEFMKVTSSATAVNVVANSSFESGVVTSWDTSVGDNRLDHTAHSFRGEHSLELVSDGSGANLDLAYNAFSAASSTVYTACGYFRRTDGAIPALGDITVGARGGTFVATTIEQTGVDAWIRACATFTSGTSGDTRAPYFRFTTGLSVVGYYVDAVQLEAGSTVRPWSEFRSSYTVTRNQDGGVANDWRAGDALFDTGGAAGYGWLDCYSISGMKSTSEVGPACVANVRTGTSATNWEPYAGWGQLNGLWGYGTSTFGFAAGPNSGYHATFDNVDGIAFWNATSKISSWDLSSGTIRIGDTTTSHPSLRISSSSMQLCSNGVFCTLTLDGATGNILGGSATALNTGTGYFLSGSATFRVGNPSGDYLRWDGTNMTVKSSNLTIDSNGVKLLPGSGTWGFSNAFGWDDGDGQNHGIAEYSPGLMWLYEQRSASTAAITIQAERVDVSKVASIVVQATNTVGSRIDLTSDGIRVNGTAGVTKTCTSLPTVVNGIVTGC
jgi:hypothetical protein